MYCSFGVLPFFGNKFLTIQKKKKLLDHPSRSQPCIKFDVGELVWVHLRKDRFPPGKFEKLKPRVDGPFKIIEKIEENVYKLQ